MKIIYYMDFRYQEQLFKQYLLRSFCTYLTGGKNMVSLSFNCYSNIIFENSAYVNSQTYNWNIWIDNQQLEDTATDILKTIFQKVWFMW